MPRQSAPSASDLLSSTRLAMRPRWQNVFRAEPYSIVSVCETLRQLVWFGETLSWGSSIHRAVLASWECTAASL